MKSLRVRNLRSLKDSGEIEMRPLTFLLGENSSGKSTFLRLMPLLKQSIEAKTKGPLLWFGRYVDFGSYREALSKFSEDDTIQMEFVLPLLNDFKLYSSPSRTKVSRFDARIGLLIEESTESAASFTKVCTISMYDVTVKITLDENQKVVGYECNKHDFSRAASRVFSVGQRMGQASSIIPVLHDSTRGSRRFSTYELQTNSLIAPLYSFLKNLLHRDVSQENLSRIVNNIVLGDADTMLASIKSSNTSLTRWTQRVARWSVTTPAFITLRDFYLAWVTPQVLYSADLYLYNYIQNIKYVAPLRATAERYYRFQDLAVDELDFQGRNLALILQNMSKSEALNFEEWTLENFGFAVRVRPSGGHSAIMIKEAGSPHEVSLADMGFGFSQVIPILAQLWLASSPNPALRFSLRRAIPVTFAIEQPELHLHPRMQARLADILYKTVQLAQKNDVNLLLLVETHSETIINRLGLRIAGGELSSDDVSVIVFEKPYPDAPAISRMATYEENGLLKDWPLGFFEPEVV
ncbi:energy-coupling factor transporter ATP-binding protein EcfA2 [Deinobacterium chartae]|uniref:Energy-coupling factor transporter ATP-binding protein EcfA2 n=1 Tax=Deinobacterium chartae TaxID=521158 RepID=A0A841HXF9_9DEIO|nr:AAA family ATPase [Deinobacterium chartae]MBB6098087.1 energy-coupling factor transporter ATP-binding protein EcfA2 [Deinobacterium chartae]